MEVLKLCGSDYGCSFFNRAFFCASMVANEESEEEILESMQADQIPKGDFHHPQVRLLAHKLTYEKVKVFISSAIADEIYFKMLKQTDELIGKYHQFIDQDAPSFGFQIYFKIK